MTLRFQWKTSQDALHLVSEPYLGTLQTWINNFSSYTLYSKLYFSYNLMTQQATIMTTDLNQSHLRMIQHLRELPGVSIRPEEIGRLLIQYVVVLQECFIATAMWWDDRATGTVCCQKLHLHLCLPPIPKSKWHHKCWTAVRTTTPVFGLLNWMPELQI